MSKIHFTDATKQKKFTLTSGNTRDVVLKLKPEDGGYLTESDLRDEIRKWASLPTELGKATITVPQDGTTNYSGNIEVGLDSNGLTMRGTYYVCFQVSSSLDFRNPEFTKWKNGSTLPTLQFNEITGIDFRTSKAIYVRARILNIDINNKIGYSTEFSSPISFFPISSSYQTSNVNVTINQDDGTIRYDFDSYRIGVGNPPKPNKVDVIIRDVALDVSSTYSYDIENEGAFSITTPKFFIGRVLMPSRTYQFIFNFKYVGDDGVLSSPNLNVTSINQYSGTTNNSSAAIGLVNLSVDEISMVTNGISMAKHPTFALKGLSSTYNFLSAPNMNMFVIGGNDEIIRLFRSGSLKTTIELYEGDVRNNLAGSTPLEVMTGSENLFNLSNTEKRDLFFNCENTLKLATMYTLVTKIKYLSDAVSETQSNMVFAFTDVRTFVSPSTYVANDVDNLTVSRTYNGVGYYGEIRTGFNNAVDYKGKYIPSTAYSVNDEVIHDGTIYKCVNSVGTESLTTPVGSSNFTTYQNVTNILPDGEWLLKKLGIPYANPIHLGIDGEIVESSNIDDVSNQYDGWIKAQNKFNQIIYISKRPFIVNMSAIELKRRGLMGSGRTIRLGEKIFKVRLMENNVNSVVNDDFNNTKKQNELDLYQYLFTNLHTYQTQELGLESSGNILLANGKLSYTSEVVGINSSLSSIDYTSDTKGSLVIVLEDILKGYEPYYKSISSSPVTDLDYDLGTDTGYYGEVSAQDLITPTEFKMIYGVSELNLTNEELFFHKFYWHGMLMYLPSKPFGKMKVKDVIKHKLFYGIENTNSIRTNGINIKTTLLNAIPNTFTYKENLNDDFKIDSLIVDLYSRVSKNLDNTKCSQFVDDKFDTTNWLDYSKYNILLKDIVNNPDENKYFLKLTGTELTPIDLEETIDFLPVFITECTDYSLDLSYPSGQYKQYVVTKEQRTVTETYLEKETVTKKREVVRERQVLTEKEEISIVKTPTGKFTINHVSKNSTYDYGLILYFCKKEDLANINDYLYSKTLLNIKQSNRNNTVFYSENIRSQIEYLARTLMVTDQDGYTGKPYHTNVFFPTVTEGMNYLTTLTDVTNIMRLSNAVPTKANHLIGSLVSGNISSREIAYPYSDFYTLTNPDLDVATPINNHVSISENNGQAIHSWPTIIDINGSTQVFPFISPYIPYEHIVGDGKTLVENFYGYLVDNNLTKLDISELCFGFVVSEISSLRYFKNGIVTGTIYSPDIINIDSSYVIPQYFGTDEENRSNGEDYLDILNKVEVFDYKEIITKVPYYETVTYTDIESYQEEVYVEKTREKVVYVDVIKYL